MSRFAELVKEARRRRVFRVVAVYIVGLWVLLQVADVLFPAIGVSEAAKLYLLLAGFICFPIAVVVGWRYDVTREGVVRTKPADPAEPQDLSLKTADYTILAVLAAVVIAVTFGLGGEILQTQSPAPVDEAVAEAPENSVAVLPFRNLSGNPDDEYFSDGITEEIINAVAQIDQIRVSGRSSSFQFKNSTTDLKTIGQQLGVANLLEGSVRRSGDRLRISAQLTNAATGFSRWSQVFERHNVDVFDIQQEIADAIGSTLQLALTADRQALDYRRTDNIEAYNAYLRGDQLANNNLREAAADEWLRAIELDPDFALPYAAFIWNCITIWGPAVSERCKERIEPYAYRMRELAPNAAETDIAFSLVYGFRDRDYLASRRLLENAVDRHPHHVDLLSNYAYELSFIWGEWELAATNYTRLLEIEPLMDAPRQSYAAMLIRMGRFEEAKYHIDKAAERVDSYWIDLIRGNWSIYQLDYVRGLDQYHSAFENGYVPINAALFVLDLEDHDRARFWLDRVNESIPGTYSALILEFMLHFARNDFQTALSIGERLARVELSPTDFDWNGMLSLAWLRYLQRSRPSAALVAYTRSYPELFKDEVVVGNWNHAAAIGLAELYTNQADEESAQKLLSSVERYFTRASDDHFLAKAAISTMQQDLQEALDYLEAYFDDDERYAWWMLDKDIVYKPLWSEPRFQNLMARFKSDMQERHALVEEAEQRGELKTYH